HDALPSHLARGVVGDAERAYLSGRLEFVERTSHFLRLDESVGAVQQEYVDPVGVQRPERSVDLAQDVLVGEVERAVLRDDPALRLDGDLIAFCRRERERLSEA